MKRNALVSVFLRVLEYYAGILFLTTNRVSTFDEAFKWRIHMSLGYPPLRRNQTEQIWRMNLERTKEAKGLNLDIDSNAILEFADNHWYDSQEDGGGGGAWNGRQIRNAFQTVIALAKWDYEQEKAPKPVLNEAHFDKVALRQDNSMRFGRKCMAKREKDPVLNNANFGVESSASKLRSVGGAQTPRRKKAAAKDIYVSEEETPYRRKKKTPVRDVSEDDESPSRRRKKPGREESEEEEPHIGRKN